MVLDLVGFYPLDRDVTLFDWALRVTRLLAHSINCLRAQVVQVVLDMSLVGRQRQLGALPLAISMEPTLCAHALIIKRLGELLRHGRTLKGRG